jgi:hypothetical protein
VRRRDDRGRPWIGLAGRARRANAWPGYPPPAGGRPEA